MYKNSLLLRISDDMNGGQLWLVMKFVFSCWMVCDMVTDCITTHSYHQACKIHHHNHTHENNTKQEFMSGSCGYFMARQAATTFQSCDFFKRLYSFTFAIKETATGGTQLALVNFT